MRRKVSVWVLLWMGALLHVPAALQGQVLREVLILRVSAGTVEDQVLRNCRPHLGPEVRMTWVEGRPADHPWPAPLRSRGVVVVEGSDGEAPSGDVPVHLPRLLLRGEGRVSEDSSEIVLSRSREEFLDWAASQLAQDRPLLELTPVGPPQVPRAGIQSEPQEQFLSDHWRLEHKGAFAGVVLPRALQPSVPLRDVLSWAREEGLAVLTGDRTIWASGADGAWLPDLGFGALSLALALKTAAAGGSVQGFHVPSRVHARLGPSGRGAMALPQKFYTCADVLLRERGP
jgi:hypothetical protein